MSEHRNTDYEGAAKATKRLVDHGNTPDNLSNVVIETLIEMSAESRINIWHRETGLSVESLAALYRLYEIGAGYRLARRYGQYEANRIAEELKRHDVSENGSNENDEEM